MQKYSKQNIQAKIGQFWASFCSVSKYWKIALIALVLVGSVGGGLRVSAEESYKSTDSIAIVKTDGADHGTYINLDNCAVYLAAFQGNWINAVTNISPCFNNGNFYYDCKKPSAANLLEAWQEQIGTNKVFVECNRRIGDDTNPSTISGCAKLSERGTSSNPLEWIQKTVGGDGRNISLVGDLAKCKPLFAEFCATMWDSNNFSSGKSDVFCKSQLGFTVKPVVATQSGAFSKVAECVKPSPAELEEIKKTLLEFDQKKDKLCKEKNGVGIYYCQKLDYAVSSEGQECIPANKEAKEVALKVTTPDVTASGGALGGLFSILYKVVITILLIVLILIEYVQMIILTIMAYIISALLDLSPSAPILTKIGLPLWQIFANLANFLVVGFMVYVGAATMIGLRKTDQAGKDVVTIAVLAMLLNTTYFFLNFVISTVDGFARLLITVFVGKGGLFGLFSGLFGLFSKVSVLRDGKGAIDVSSPVSAVGNFGGTLATAAGNIAENFGKNDNGAALTFTFLGEALVVISFFIILLIFKDTFILVFARVTILLLLLITSPVWVVAFFLKDIFKSSPISAAISKLPSQLLGTIFYNFALVLGIIITVLVTGTAQEGFKNYRLDIGDGGTIAGGGGADAANFLNPNGASLIIAGVVPVFLGVSILYFINQAFKNLFPLLDQIASQVGNGAADFAKGIISGDVKSGIAKFAKGATTLATGGGQLENVATLAPKLGAKIGVMGAGGLAMVGDGLTGGRLGLQQRLANAEDRFIKPMVYKPSEAFSNWAGERFGENSDQNLNARERTKRIRDQKKGIRDDRNRGVVANSMDEYNNSNALTGGRRYLVKGAEAKMNADIAEKRMNAGKKTIEQEGRERYLAGNAGAIQEAANREQFANDRESAVNDRISGQEEIGKEGYYNSAEGRAAGEALDTAKNSLEQLKTIADNVRKGQKSTNDAGYFADPANIPLITRATESTLRTDLQKGTDDANIDKVKAGLETAFNQNSANSTLIQGNASAKLSAETVRRTTTASRGVVEEAGKQGYYSSIDGKAQVLNAVLSEQELEQDQTISNSAKDTENNRAKAFYYSNGANTAKIQSANTAKINSELQKTVDDSTVNRIKSNNDAAYYNDNSNLGLINSAAKSSIMTGVEKEINDAQVDTKKAMADAGVYRKNRTTMESMYNQLSDLKYGNNGLSQAESNKKKRKKLVTGGYQAKLDQENAAKRFKERQDKEREDAVAYTAAKAGTGTPDQIQFYDEALADWNARQNEFNQKILDVTTNSAYQNPPVTVGAFTVPGGIKPEAQAILDNLMREKLKHDGEKP